MIHEKAQAQLQEMMPLAEALFGMTEVLLKKSGNFLPHGGSLDLSGQVSLAGAAPENDITNSVEVLPLLHAGLRNIAASAGTQAVAVCENVFIGEDQTPAVKVLCEHRYGFCAALYLPFKIRLFRGPSYGDLQVVEAKPEVGGWSD